jgi:hypothetical protein
VPGCDREGERGGGDVVKTRVSFRLNDRKLKEKTDTWEVWRLDCAAHVGRIRWHSPWRKYSFSPSAETEWDQDCLRVIAEFIETETRKHVKGRRAFAAEVSE